MLVFDGVIDLWLASLNIVYLFNGYICACLQIYREWLSHMETDNTHIVHSKISVMRPQVSVDLKKILIFLLWERISILRVNPIWISMRVIDISVVYNFMMSQFVDFRM